MKKIKICKCLCLLFAIVLTLFTTSMTTYLSYTNNGSTKVVAHIETEPHGTTQPFTDNNNDFVTQDESDVSTGEVLSICFIIVLFLISIIVIFICSNSHFQKKKKQTD